MVNQGAAFEHGSKNSYVYHSRWFIGTVASSQHLSYDFIAQHMPWHIKTSVLFHIRCTVSYRGMPAKDMPYIRWERLT